MHPILSRSNLAKVAVTAVFCVAVGLALEPVPALGADSADLVTSMLVNPESGTVPDCSGVGLDVHVENLGPDTAPSVKVYLLLPRGASLYADTGDPAQYGSLLVWSAGSFALDDAITYKVSFDAPCSGSGTGSIVEWAFASGTPDPHPFNNFAVSRLSWAPTS
jgi:hypothetical protein